MQIDMSPDVKKDGSFWDLLKAQLPEKKGSLFESEKARVTREKEAELQKKIDRDNQLARDFKREIADRAEPIQRKIDDINKVLENDTTITADRAMELRQEKQQLCNDLYNLYDDADARSVQYYDTNFRAETLTAATQAVQAQQELEAFKKGESEVVIEKEKEEKEVTPKIEPEVDVRIKQKIETIQKEIELLEKELANNLTITADRALEVLQQLSKLLSELAKLYAGMVSQSSIQYR